MHRAAERMTPAARTALRTAIAQAGGVEVFAIGTVEGGLVSAITVVCRGTEDRVPALLERPVTGQVVLHNHPSGDLRPSGPDLALAARYGDDGVGVAIVDSSVERVNFVVEPHARPAVAVDPDEVTDVFLRRLPTVMTGTEARPAQLRMALGVAAALSAGRPLVVEAGTGTGKSLAYAVPAALWARDNPGRVVISTWTRQLQTQLVRADLPILPKLGLDVPYAVLQGRTNYVCKRRLNLAAEEGRHEDDETRSALESLVAWEAASPDGTRNDLPESVHPDVWERVESDTDLTLRLRCPFYETCRYYEARRRAAGARIVVVNHALLLADLSLKHQEAPGILPTYSRIVLDEGHHLEEAATSGLAEGTTARAIGRLAGQLVGPRGKPGVLARIALATEGTPSLPAGRKQVVLGLARDLEEIVGALRGEAPRVLERLDQEWLDQAGTPVRVTEAVAQTEAWTDRTAPLLVALADQIEIVTRQAEAIERALDGDVLPPDRIQPLLDLTRLRRRLAEHAKVVRGLLTHQVDWCRWLERAPGRRSPLGGPGAALRSAPIDVAEVLREVLWRRVPGVVATSATMAIGGDFGFWSRTVGLTDEQEVARDLLPSPFDHASQALLGVPKDLHDPGDPTWLDASARAVLEAIRASDGGAFVLCTSHQAVRAYAAAIREDDPRRLVLAQGEAPSPGLLRSFVGDRRAVLVGTDSFWEGVSVKGDGLRLVVIPRLPFRVPTEPLVHARAERVTQRGGDAFQELALPTAILKLRQGYGRLIRSHTDRGVVLLLDPRLHSRRFGPRIVAALPPARRVAGPWFRVRLEVQRFFSG